MPRWTSIGPSLISRSLRNVLSGIHCLDIYQFTFLMLSSSMKLACHGRPNMNDSKRTMKAMVPNHRKQGAHVERACPRRTQIEKSITTHPVGSASFTAGQLNSVNTVPTSSQAGMPRGSETVGKKSCATSKEHKKLQSSVHLWQSNRNKTWTEHWCASFHPKNTQKPPASYRSNQTDLRAQSAPRGREKLAEHLMVSTKLLKAYLCNSYHVEGASMPKE